MDFEVGKWNGFFGFMASWNESSLIRLWNVMEVALFGCGEVALEDDCYLCIVLDPGQDAVERFIGV